MTAIELYSGLKLPELKAILKRRKLRVSGNKQELNDRLRQVDWKDWLSANSTFHQFSKFPTEIQSLIWHHSLPGPRVLSASPSDATSGLKFPKEHHTPNPAALSTCQASRTVALRRYKLVFDSPFVYADLTGGDMIYFGPWNDWLDIEMIWGFIHRDKGEIKISATALADLEQVRHVILHFDFLKDYDDDTGRYQAQGPVHLREELKGFKRLETLSLCRGGTDRFGHYDSPGQVVIEDNERNFRDGKEDEDDVWWDYPRTVTDNIAKSFHKKSMFETEEEAKNMRRIHIKAVEANRLTDLHGRLFKKEKDLPEPELYVSSLRVFNGFADGHEVCISTPRKLLDEVGLKPALSRRLARDYP